MDDSEAELLKELLDGLLKRAEAEQVSEMEAEWSADSMPEISPTAVVLYGFEGNVDATSEMRDRPNVLLRAIPARLTAARPLDPDDYVPLPVAEYRRIGESTYQRTR